MSGPALSPSTRPPNTPGPSRTTETWPMLRAMVGIGLVCGLVIVASYQWSKPIIEKNRAEALRRAIFEVVPGAARSTTFRYDEPAGFTPATGATGNDQIAQLVHAAYDERGALAGVAIEAAGMGYQDTIRILYGYSPVRQAIVGFQVLESRETPGLGDKIGLDPDFLANFEALDLTLGADGATLAHPPQLVKKGEKTKGWQIDAITGATVSSRAITEIVRESAALWAPRIVPRVEQLAEEKRP